ncbi:hypothetical protein D3C85_1240690 [compost metagenome]
MFVRLFSRIELAGLGRMRQCQSHAAQPVRIQVGGSDILTGANGIDCLFDSIDSHHRNCTRQPFATQRFQRAHAHVVVGAPDAFYLAAETR